MILFVSFYWNVSDCIFWSGEAIRPNINLKFFPTAIWMFPRIVARSKNNRSINLNNRFTISGLFCSIFDINLLVFLEILILIKSNNTVFAKIIFELLSFQNFQRNFLFPVIWDLKWIWFSNIILMSQSVKLIMVNIVRWFRCFSYSEEKRIFNP